MATRIVIFLVIGAAVAIGGFVLRDVTSGNVTDLKAGDCFDFPTGVEQISDVQHHPCKEAHTAEIVGVFVYPGEANDAYPSPDTLHSFAEAECLGAFRSYTGRDPINDTLLTLGWTYPTAETWSHGEHGLNCYLARIDDGKMTQSYRAGTT